MLSRFDVLQNELHRTMVNSQVKMHQAANMQKVPTGEQNAQAPVQRSNGGGTQSPRGAFGTLRPED